jgi:hypothetical protein
MHFFAIDGYDLQADLRIDRGDTVRGRIGGLLAYAREGMQILKTDNQVTTHSATVCCEQHGG